MKAEFHYSVTTSMIAEIWGPISYKIALKKIKPF